HKMDEVRDHADVVTVLRRGAVVSTRRLDRAGDLVAQVDDVAAAIMGASGPAARRSHEPRRSGSEVENAEGTARPIVLEARDLRVGRALDGVSIVLRRGQIVGVAGVEGNGQRELVAVLAGDVVPDGGAIATTPPDAPIATIREDRQTDGLVLDA